MEDENKELVLGGRGNKRLSEKAVLDIFTKHRVRHLTKYINKNFINNDEFLDSVRELTNGTLKCQRTCRTLH